MPKPCCSGRAWLGVLPGQACEGLARSHVRRTDAAAASRARRRVPRVAGKWIFQDKTEYIGDFENNMPLGPGTFKFYNGNTQSGEYITTGLDQTLSWNGEPTPL